MDLVEDGSLHVDWPPLGHEPAHLVVLGHLVVNLEGGRLWGTWFKGFLGDFSFGGFWGICVLGDFGGFVFWGFWVLGVFGEFEFWGFLGNLSFGGFWGIYVLGVFGGIEFWRFLGELSFGGFWGPSGLWVLRCGLKS